MAEEKEGSSTRLIIASAVSVVMVAIGAYAAWWCWRVSPGGDDYSSAGAFGDAFAPVTGLLSTLALAAAVTSVLLQRRELELQRQELKDTRQVLAEQKAAQEKLAAEQEQANRLAQLSRAIEVARLENDIVNTFSMHVEGGIDTLLQLDQSYFRKCDNVEPRFLQLYLATRYVRAQVEKFHPIPPEQDQIALPRDGGWGADE